MSDTENEEVSTENRPFPGIKPPQPLTLVNNPVESWKLFKQRWQTYAILSRLSTQPKEVQVALFLHCLADDALKIYNGFAFETEEDRRTVDEITTKFEEFAIGDVNETYERFIFNRRVQEEGESFDTFHADLKSLIKTCNYCGKCTDSIMRDRIVLGIRDASTRTDLLKERNLTIAKCVDICKMAESASLQNSALKPEVLSKVSLSSPHKGRSKPNPAKERRKPTKQKQPYKECKFCDTLHPWKKELCPAWGKTCQSCKRPNHLAVKCPDSRHLHSVVEREDSSDEEWVNAVHSARGKQLKCKMMIQDEEVIFQIDTGATVNVLPQKYATDINPTTRTLQMWNDTTMQPIGTCRLPLKNPANNKKYNVPFTVVKDGHTPLIGLQAAEDMKLLKINDKNMDQVASITSDPLAPFDAVFNRTIGSLPGKTTLRVKEGSIPSVMPTRRTPVAIRDKLKDELDRMTELGVITKVDKPTPWVSQVVVVHKKSGELRICIDPQELNKALVREHFIMPILEEKLHDLGRSRVFSKADLSSGYWHVHLDEASSYLTTFQTCHGRYRWLRLPFGTSVSAEIFQKKVLEALDGLPGIICIADDVIVHGRDTEEHDAHLRAFLQRCMEVGIKLNKDKLELHKSELTFMGHRVTQDGLQPDPEKVKAISDMKEPKDIHELRRFLGCVNFLTKYIPHSREAQQPLLNLLCKDVPYQWSEAQQEAFDSVKRSVTSSGSLAFYDPNKELVLENDASEYGIGSAIYQEGKPIAFASRTLTDTESRYAQIEKEMLAVTYGLTKFHHYTYGRDVLVVTDHKPLVSITRKPLSKAPRRLQNLLLKAQEYNYTLEYRPGKSIPVADALSRAPLTEGGPAKEKVHHVFYTPFRKDRLQEVKEATRADEVLTELKKVILSGWPLHKDDVPAAAKPYYDYRDELTVQDGLVLRGERIVIPATMRADMKQRVHAGHLGINSCLRRARELIYWPGMSSEIRQHVESCATCASFGTQQPAEPLITNEVPDGPFRDVSTDLFHTRGREYLVTVDNYSNFIEVDHLQTATSEEVITKLKHHFARHGIPEVVRSDNGPQYSSANFKKFADTWEFSHITSSPGYSQGNGAAEAAVKTVKRILQKTHQGGGDPYLGLLNLRNTPTEGLNLSPSQRLMGRRTRTLLPTASTTLKQVAPKDVTSEMGKKKAMAASRTMWRPQLKPLQPGDQVRIKPTQPGEKKWAQATVTTPLGARSYQVERPDGGTLRRNRRHLRLQHTHAQHTHAELAGGGETPHEHAADSTGGTPDGSPAETREPQEANQPTPQRPVGGTSDSRSRSGRLINVPRFLQKDYILDI